MRRFWVLYGLVLSLSAFAQSGAKAKAPQFDVVSIKLNHSDQDRGTVQISPDGDRVVVSNSPMYRIVGFAFDFKRNDLVLGAPDWTHTERWDIEAKVPPEDLGAFRALTFKQQEAMLQSVLMERCKMQAHIEKKEVPVYALMVGKRGVKMQEVKAIDQPWDLIQKHGEIHGRAVPVGALMYALSNASLERLVIDRTGLMGTYNFDLLWTPAEDPVGETPTEMIHPSIFTAVQEQLGLRLVETKALVDALVIEHIERPTPN